VAIDMFGDAWVMKQSLIGREWNDGGIGGRLDHGGAPDMSGVRHIRDQTSGWRTVRRLVNRDVRHPACSKAPRAQSAIKHAANKKRLHANSGACAHDRIG